MDYSFVGVEISAGWRVIFFFSLFLSLFVWDGVACFFRKERRAWHYINFRYYCYTYFFFFFTGVYVCGVIR